MTADDRQTTGIYLFLSGAEMHPTEVLAAYPGAKFVARARVAVPRSDVASPFAGHLSDGSGSAEVWGILIRCPDGTADGQPRDVTTDDGRIFQALTTNGQLRGDPQAVLAQAHYWELPPDYVVRLRDAMAALGVATGDDE